MSNKGKVALVTGAAQGIGYGIAECLTAEGADLVICDVQEESAVAEGIGLLRSQGAEVLYCRCDISDSRSRAGMIEEIKSRFGRLNVLVNNAGIAPKERADILDATEESFERVMRINLQGAYFLTQGVARWMVEQKKADNAFDGCIVNISSISATVASPSRGEYCVSKAGLSMATKLWAVRLGEFDIPVYEVRPGIIKTPMTAVVDDKYTKMIEEGLCVQSRWGMPKDVGNGVAMLTRGDIAYSTGQVILVDGGLTLGRL